MIPALRSCVSPQEHAIPWMTHNALHCLISSDTVAPWKYWHPVSVTYLVPTCVFYSVNTGLPK